MHLLKEIGDANSVARNQNLALPGPDFVELRLVVNPSAGTVTGFAQPCDSGTGGCVPLSSEIKMGNPVPIPSSWLTSSTTGLAVGIISTSAGPAPSFPATWDYLHVEAA